MTRLTVALAFLILARVLPADDLSAILARMDQAASVFHSMTADLKMVTYTAILDDKTTESGKLEMEKDKNGTEAVISFTGPDARTIAFLNKQIQLYTPKLNLIQIYKLAKSGKLLDQFLLLGFGASGKELAKSYNIQLGGIEQVNGQNASKLVLTPKEPGVKEQISQAELWIPGNSGYPVQQKFYNPSGNYRLATYTNFQLNPQLGPLKLNAPPNTKIEYPQ
jgi:outer membrane lipoprotein-sorting protein